jgi:hypothetical protein
MENPFELLEHSGLFGYFFWSVHYFVMDVLPVVKHPMPFGLSIECIIWQNVRLFNAGELEEVDSRMTVRTAYLTS